VPDHTSTPDETAQALRAAIVATLAGAGWVYLEKGTAIASKTYPTAVGPKESLAYLADFGPSETSYLLQGQYHSEGWNVLGARTVSIPKNGDPATVMRLVETFAAGAEEAVMQSYAARLYRLPDAPTDETGQGEGESEDSAPSM
jgi:hypothetical protein